MKKNILNTSEFFASIQGEGWTTGVPAYFIRLAGCNLSCGLGSKGIVELTKELKTLDEDQYKAGGFDHKYAHLVNEGKATWVCDSASVWLRGKETSFEDIIADWKKQNVYDWIMSQRMHVIWTGGEPTIAKHQMAIVEFLDYVYDTYKVRLFNEIETNGTLHITTRLFDYLDQINCSVKLGNSGMSKDKRINEEALLRIMDHHNHWFKFVISTEDDIKEILDDLVRPLGISEDRIIIMPGLDRQEELFERTNFTLEMAKKYGFIGSTRLHIAAWGAVTGV